MENRKLNKIKVSQVVFSRIERAAVELIELIQAGESTQSMRDALVSIQSILPALEVEKSFPIPTWEGPTPGDAA